MDDGFLYRARPQVRREFAERLWDRLNKRTKETTAAGSVAVTRPMASLRPILGVLALVALAAAVWQGITYFWEQRGEFWVHEGDIQCTQVFWGWYQTSGMNQPARGQPDNEVPLTEALGLLDYQVKVPTWAPEGLTLRTSTWAPSTAHDNIVLTWDRASGEALTMTANPDGFVPEAQAPAGAVEIAEIRGQPGILVRGRCAFPDPEELMGLSPGSTYETDWDESLPWLAWKDEGVGYWLTTRTPPVAAEDLIKMAESAR